MHLWREAVQNVRRRQSVPGDINAREKIKRSPCASAPQPTLPARMLQLCNVAHTPTIANATAPSKSRQDAPTR